MHGHLSTDHVDLTRAPMHDCQGKAGSLSHEPLLSPESSSPNSFQSFFLPPFSFPGYNAQPTENKSKSIANGIPRTPLQSLQPDSLSVRLLLPSLLTRPTGISSNTSPSLPTVKKTRVPALSQSALPTPSACFSTGSSGASVDLLSSPFGEALTHAGDRLQRVAHGAHYSQLILILFGHQLIEMLHS